MKRIPTLLLFLVTIACSNKQTSGRFVDWQGHRGARGVLPENSLEGFLYALDAGMVTLEMDVVISGDSQVVVSHEPYMNAEICLDTNNQALSAERVEQLNLFTMSYAEIARYDCGSKRHARFPEQRKQFAYKPLLKDILQACEAYAAQTGRMAPFYNIELKSAPEAVGVSQPEHAVFAALVLAVVDSAKVSRRTTIQSFDALALNAAHAQNEQLVYSFLFEEKPASLEELLSTLNFSPQVLSPDYHLVDPSMRAFATAHDMHIIPWTVNDSATAAQLLELGVDGLITDYPELRIKLEGNK
jgi:glycerophosphoryl diester phosphodiesterase